MINIYKLVGLMAHFNSLSLLGREIVLKCIKHKKFSLMKILRHEELIKCNYFVSVFAINLSDFYFFPFFYLLIGAQEIHVEWH